MCPKVSYHRPLSLRQKDFDEQVGRLQGLQMVRGGRGGGRRGGGGVGGGGGQGVACHEALVCLGRLGSIQGKMHREPVGPRATERKSPLFPTK